jgi:dynein heavy chain
MVLKNVHESEEEVQNMLVEIGNILENNFPGPETFITYYEIYSYLLNGTETEALNTFFEIQPFPLLSVCILELNY